MGQKFADNGRALLTVALGAADTTMTLEAAKADRFPVANTTDWLAPADWFKVALFDAAGNREVVKVGTRTAGSNILGNLLRAQDGTTALAMPAGSVALHVLTAADLESMAALAQASSTFTGVNTFQQQQVFEQGVQIGEDWTITEEAGSLFFTHGGVKKMKLDATGNLTVTGTIYLGGVL